MNWVIVIIVIVEILLTGVVIALEKRTARKNKISFQETLALTDLPIVTFYNNGRKLNFVLDTGANQSIINNKELYSCVYEATDERSNLIGITGGSKGTHSIINMTLIRGKQSFSESFQVSDLSKPFSKMKEAYGVEVHGIIGNTFFTKYKYILDFDELAAYTH